MGKEDVETGNVLVWLGYSGYSNKPCPNFSDLTQQKFVSYTLCGGRTALQSHLGAQSDGGSIILKLELLEDKIPSAIASVNEDFIGRSQASFSMLWSKVKQSPRHNFKGAGKCEEYMEHLVNTTIPDIGSLDYIEFVIKRRKIK